MFNQNDADALRAALQPFDFDRTLEPDELTRRYLAHYRIDFPDLQARHSFGHIDTPEFRLAAHCFRPPTEPKGSLFILHGYFDHSGLYRHVIRHALKQGLVVFIFDLPGHGLSSGEQVAIDDFVQYRHALTDCLRLAERAALPRPWSLLGQSKGGAVAMDYVLHTASWRSSNSDNPPPPSFDQQYLLGPLVRPRRWYRLRILFALRRHFADTVPRRFTFNSSDPEFLEFLREKDPLQPRIISGKWIASLIRWQSVFKAYPPCPVPTTVFQGDNDGTVDWQYNLKQLHKKFSNLKVVMIPGGRHHLSNESEPLRKQIFRHIP